MSCCPFSDARDALVHAVSRLKMPIFIETYSVVQPHFLKLLRWNHSWCHSSESSTLQGYVHDTCVSETSNGEKSTAKKRCFLLVFRDFRPDAGFFRWIRSRIRIERKKLHRTDQVSVEFTSVQRTDSSRKTHVH
jgi:hypothetical protein